MRDQLITSIMDDDNPPGKGGTETRKRARLDYEINNSHHFPNLGAGSRAGKYLLIESVNSETKITQLRLKVLDMFFKRYFPKHLRATQTREGKFVVLTNAEQSLKKSIGIFDLGYNDLKVKVSEHPTLNLVKGTVYSKALVDEDLDELLSSLSDQNVVKLERIMRRENGIEIPTSTVIVTFKGVNLPSSVKIAYLNLAIRPFYPNPLRCTICQLYGHTRNHCSTKQQFCRTCAEESPHAGDCITEKCRNCHGSHPSGSKICPKHHVEQNIIRIQTDRRISYHMARAEFNRSYRIENISYSQATQKHSQSQLNQQSQPISQESQRSPEIDDLIKQMAEMKRYTQTQISELSHRLDEKDEIERILRLEISQKDQIIQRQQDEIEELKRKLNSSNPTLLTSPIKPDEVMQTDLIKRNHIQFQTTNKEVKTILERHRRERNRENTSGIRSRSNSGDTCELKTRYYVIKENQIKEFGPEVKVQFETLQKDWNVLNGSRIIVYDFKKAQLTSIEDPADGAHSTENENDQQ